MNDSMKYCNGCCKNLPTSDFTYVSNPGRCGSCMKAYYKKYYAENKARYKNNARNYKSTVMGRAKTIMGQIRHRNKKLNVSVDVSESLIVRKLEAGVCEGSGLPLNVTDVRVHWDNPLGPSLDRIVSEEGYTDSNIQLVCNMYNRGKNKHPEIDFIAMCVAVAEKHGDRQDVIDRLAEMRQSGPRGRSPSPSVSARGQGCDGCAG